MPSFKYRSAVRQEPSAQPATLLRLFTTFAQIGLFTFGGGLAMLPLIQKAVVNRNHWMEVEDYTNMLAVSNSTPGAFSINAAIFIGFRLHGLAGAICCTLGIVLPSFIIILLLATVLSRFQNNLWVQKFFHAVTPVIIAIIFSAGLQLARQSLRVPLDYGICAIGFLILLLTGAHPVLVIIGGGLTGWLFASTSRRQTNDKSKSTSREGK